MASSSLAQFTRAGVSDIAKRGKKAKKPALTVAKTQESDSGDKPSRFRVVLIKEGMGNFGDRYYYPAEAIREAAPLFEGAQIFSDHDTPEEAEQRPERSVDDLRGHFENVAPAKMDDGRTCLEADVVIPAGRAFDMARDLMRHAVDYSKKYPDKNFVGLSINANGTAEERDIDDIAAPAGAQAKLAEAKEKGITQVKYVKKLTVADSCDLVTKPGAGGEVIKMLEADIKHGPKWTSCVHKVDKKGNAVNPYAVCTTSVGSQKEKTVKKEAKKEAGSHDDADQDAALIKKMMKDHAGKDDPTEEETEAAKSLFGKAMKIHDGDAKEAYETAGRSMKMAMHNQAESEAEAKKEAEAKEAADKAAADGKKTDDDGDADDAAAKEKKEAEAKEEEAKKEAAKKLKDDSVKLREAEANNLKQAGEIASLKARIRIIELQEHVDKKLKESKLPNSATKLFREKMGEVKSEKEVDEKLSIFVEAWSAGGTPSTELLIEAERGSPSSQGESETSLANCVR